VRHTFTPLLSLTLTDTLVRSDEPDLGDQGGLRRERKTFTSNTFGASADWRIDLVATQFYYRNSTFFGDNDTTSHILGVNASTPLGTDNSLRLGYEYTTRGTTSGGSTQETTGHRVLGSFSRQLQRFLSAGVSSSYTLNQSEASDSRIWNISLFSVYGTPAGFSLSSSLGYGLIQRDQSSTLSTFTTSTIASYAWAGRAVVSLAASQDFRQTADEGQDFGTVVTRSLRGSFSYQLTPFIGLNARASYSRNESTGEGNQTSDRASSTFSAGAGLSWRLLYWLNMSLDYTHSERTSDTSTRLTTGSKGSSNGGGSRTDSIENRAALHLTATF
jgi:hypothetical protein